MFDPSGDLGATNAAVPSAGRATRGSASAKRVPRPRTELELLAEISSKLDRTVAVLAAQGKDRDTQAAIFAAAGCDSSFVATIMGITPGAVRNLPGWKRVKVSALSTKEQPNEP